MKKLLIILLLIIGCTSTKPPSAQFYLGMTEEEFIIDNEITLNADGFYNYESKNRIIYQRGNSEYLHSIAPKLYPKDQPFIMYSETKHQNKLSPYFFIFENGFFNFFRYFFNDFLGNRYNFFNRYFFDHLFGDHHGLTGDLDRLVLCNTMRRSS